MARTREAGKGYDRAMTSAFDRTWLRLGGVAAFLALALATLRVVGVLTVFRGLYDPGSPPGTAPFAEYWGMAALEACAVAAAVFGTWRLMQPANRVLVAGAIAGGVSAAMLLAGSLAAVPMQVHGPPRWLEFSCVPLGIWMLCVVAADWRMRRLPAWLRVTGAVLGAVLMVLPALLVLRMLTVVGVGWWIGLGVVLLRADRSTSP